MNAKQEFLEEVQRADKKVVCATLLLGEEYRNNTKEFNLPVGYTEGLYKKFVASLNFEYDNGFGGQELYGIIWYADGAWSERDEYDGSEWWAYRETPCIPDSLLNLAKG
jgi:hypothetical protein